MIRWAWVLLFACACQSKSILNVSTPDDFEVLTGKDLPTWSYVQTRQDAEYLAFFKQIYEERKNLLDASSESSRIPKIAHFIWIGPLPFPRASVENIRTWMAKNPDWTFYFWTDRERPSPLPEMQIRRTQDLSFLKLKNCYAKSDSYGEKSDLLRYEILFQEGGVYVDHDVKCFQSFDRLNSAYDFYCGIDMPYTSSLPSCIYTTNNLIGAKKQHPILYACMQMLEKNWDKIGEDYPGADRDAMLNRVLHRTFWFFGQAVKQYGNLEDNRDIVFPAYYFDAPKEELAIYARHQYAGVWHENESKFEKMVRQRLMTITKKSNKMLLFLGVFASFNLLTLFGFYLFMKRAIKK